jgi:hypothetical protein
MKFLRYSLRLIWWLAAAYIPVAQYQFYEGYRRAIACPASGDCYTPGSEHLLGMELLFFGSAVVLWPLCAWHLLVGPWRAYRRAAQLCAPADRLRRPLS